MKKKVTWEERGKQLTNELFESEKRKYRHDELFAEVKEQLFNLYQCQSPRFRKGCPRDGTNAIDEVTEYLGEMTDLVKNHKFEDISSWYCFYKRPLMLLLQLNTVFHHVRFFPPDDVDDDRDVVQDECFIPLMSFTETDTHRPRERMLNALMKFLAIGAKTAAECIEGLSVHWINAMRRICKATFSMDGYGIKEEDSRYVVDEIGEAIDDFRYAVFVADGFEERRYDMGRMDEMVRWAKERDGKTIGRRFRIAYDDRLGLSLQDVSNRLKFSNLAEPSGKRLKVLVALLQALESGPKVCAASEPWWRGCFLEKSNPQAHAFKEKYIKSDFTTPRGKKLNRWRFYTKGELRQSR